MRLIDADAFKDWLLNRFSKPQDTLVLTMQGFIAEQPTAYDIDKVVEELEEYLKSERNFNDIIDTGSEIKNPVVTRMIGRIEAFEKAIEIVKQVGVSDDVCKWKYDTTYSYYKVGCKETIVPIQYGDYCPYCGKKIKAVK